MKADRPLIELTINSSGFTMLIDYFHFIREPGLCFTSFSVSIFQSRCTPFPILTDLNCLTNLASLTWLNLLQLIFTWLIFASFAWLLWCIYKHKQFLWKLDSPERTNCHIVVKSELTGILSMKTTWEWIACLYKPPTPDYIAREQPQVFLKGGVLNKFLII